MRQDVLAEVKCHFIFQRSQGLGKGRNLSAADNSDNSLERNL